MESYSSEVLDHFYHPRNMGEIANADGIGEVGNLRCGDVMYVYIKVGRRSAVGGRQEEKKSETALNSPPTANRKPPTDEYIKDIKFKTLGCAAAIASSSMMTELVKGKTLKEAMKVSRDDINQALGILPKQKYHCSILSAEGIHKAIKDYQSKKGMKHPSRLGSRPGADGT